MSQSGRAQGEKSSRGDVDLRKQCLGVGNGHVTSDIFLVSGVEF